MVISSKLASSSIFLSNTTISAFVGGVSVDTGRLAFFDNGSSSDSDSSSFLLVEDFADFVSFLGGVSLSSEVTTRFGRPADLGVVPTLFFPFGETLAAFYKFEYWKMDSGFHGNLDQNLHHCPLLPLLRILHLPLLLKILAFFYVLFHVLVELLVAQHHHLDSVLPSFSSVQQPLLH